MSSNSREKIRSRLNAIFIDIFDDDEIEIADETTADDIEEWDSIMHVTMVVAVEKEFGVELVASEVGKLENVGAMLDLLLERATR